MSEFKEDAFAEISSPGGFFATPSREGRATVRSLLTVSVLLLVLWALPAQAAFRIEPRLTLRQEFTDNLFLTATNKRSDFITTIAPGILLTYDARLLDLELDYGLNFLKYLHNDDEDETRLKDIQRVRLDGTFRPERDFSASFSDEFQRVTVDERRPIDEESPFVNRANRNLLIVNPEYRTRRFGIFEPAVGYIYERIDFVGPEGDDSYSHIVYTDLRRQFNPRTEGILGARQRFYRSDGQDDFGRSDDYNRLDLTGRLNYRFGPALSLSAGGGSGWISYRQRSNEQGLLWDLALDYEPGPRWRSGILYRQDFVQTVDRGLTRSRRVEASFDYLERLPTRLLVYARDEKFQSEDREDRSVGTEVRVSVPFAGRLALDFSGDASIWRFKPENEDVFRYSAGLAARYRIRWGFLSAGYRYRVSDSDLDENDYRSNVIFVQGNLIF